MRKAARAIIIQDNKLLLMQRDKDGARYYTLVGGKINDNESPEEGLIREVKEETSLDITRIRLVYIEEHPEPYNEQYIYLCEVAPNDEVKIQSTSEEALLNQIGMNIHTPVWIDVNLFPKIPFRTIQLQEAMVKAHRHGFPNEPIKI